MYIFFFHHSVQHRLGHDYLVGTTMFRWHSAFGGSHWGRFRLELFGTMEPMEPGASQKKSPKCHSEFYRGETLALAACCWPHFNQTW